jgi:hypothetical protein
MSKKDSQLLEEAYLSIAKKTTAAPSDAETTSTEPNKVVDVGPMDEPAPGVDMNMIDSEVTDVEPEDKDTTGVPVSMSEEPLCDCGSDSCNCDMEQEDEEDQMSISNLSSIRESIVKIASFCAGGGHLEIWAQQKLAIAMDNLAEVARRLH